MHDILALNIVFYFSEKFLSSCFQVIKEYIVTEDCVAYPTFM